MSTPNPYAAPKAAVADETVVLSADFISGGESRPAANGWTWIVQGWELFKRQPALWIGMTVLLFVIFLGTSLIPFLGLFFGVLWPVFMGGIAIGCRALHEGGQLEIGHLFAGFQRRAGALIGVGVISFVLSFAVVFAVFALMGGGMLAALGSNDPETVAGLGLGLVLAMLIVAALLLPLMMALWFAPPLVVFHEMGAWESMKQSFVGCLRNMVPFLIYGAVLLVLGVLAAIPLGLGWLVLWPVIAASIYTAYRDIYFRSR
jgi:hypothetical protein